MKKILLKNILLTVFMIMAFAPLSSLADPVPPPVEDPLAPPPARFDIKIKNPFSGGNDLYSFIKTIINEILIPIGGVVAVLMIMYAGFMYVTARGNPAQISKAHDALLYGAIGAAILLGAWVIAGAIEGTVNELKV